MTATPSQKTGTQPARRRAAALADDPLWYKDGVIYELHVRAFRDSSGDGVGDFRGLYEKLDYLQGLGITAIWLLPFYVSPLRDDGYDTAEYTTVHPSYGTIRDFEAFLKEAHRRGLRVITELVLNHTSDQHAWFQRARRAKPGSAWRDFYVWSDTPERYRDARIIFKDFEASNWTWDPVAKAYYWHRFYSHQPDLNFESPHVKKALFQVVDFWMKMGVDGLRLDAVPYLYEREGTDCENLPETHAFLRELRRHVDSKWKNRMLLGEANQWPEDSVAYFGAGDECHMAFHFPLMPRLFMGIRMEDRFPIVDILQQTPGIPESCQWATFLRNHDELTLEMVTDEDRDYMYRMYAHDPQARVNLGIRRRLAPLLGDDRKKIEEAMNGLLFSLPGTPVIYYGDEIGMGDNIYLGDRNGVRTPMQWSGDRNAGFSNANPQKLYLPVILDPEYHFETVNVEAQQGNPHSLLWWMKRVIAIRRRHPALSRGTLEFLHTKTRQVLVFLRRYHDETVLVIANLSRFVQPVRIDLSAFKGRIPVEIFGRTEFPAIGDQEYFVTLGPHNFYWFVLRAPRAMDAASSAGGPAAEAAGAAETVAAAPARPVPLLRAPLEPEGSAALAAILPDFLRTRRWFGGKSRTIQGAEVVDRIPVTDSCAFILVRVDYTSGEPETYVLPLAQSLGEQADEVRRARPESILARTEAPGSEGVLHDALADPCFSGGLLVQVARRRSLRGARGTITATKTKDFQRLLPPDEPTPDPAPLGGEQSNTSIAYGDRIVLKLFRRLGEGINPDLELGVFLSDGGKFPHTPPVCGALEYRRDGGEPMTIAVLKGFVRNEGEAWRYTLDAVERCFERVLARAEGKTPEEVPLPREHVLDSAAADLPRLVAEVIGTYLESARLLGVRVGELHVALASDPEDPRYAPENFSPLYQRSVYQGFRNHAGRVFQLLRDRRNDLPEQARGDAQKVIDLEGEVMARFKSLLGRRVTGRRIRCHGDLHLGQILFTGKDFAIIDFEGEPARPLGERRIKRSPLRDVAGMLRSFHYAAYTVLIARLAPKIVRPEDLVHLEVWARAWHHWVSSAFLKAWLAATAQAPDLLCPRDEMQLLLDTFVLDKAVYELGYELDNRPDWVGIPLLGMLSILERGR